MSEIREMKLFRFLILWMRDVNIYFWYIFVLLQERTGGANYELQTGDNQIA